MLTTTLSSSPIIFTGLLEVWDLVLLLLSDLRHQSGSGSFPFVDDIFVDLKHAYTFDIGKLSVLTGRLVVNLDLIDVAVH